MGDSELGKHEAIRKAMSRIDENGMTSGRNEDIEFLVDVIFEQSNIGSIDDKTSDLTKKRKIREALQNVKSSDPDSAVDEFEIEESNIKTELHEKEPTQYTVAFPLNFSASSIDFPDEFEIGEVTIRRVDEDKWKSEYFSEAKDALERNPKYISSANEAMSFGFTYWIAECEAAGPRYALLLANEAVTVLIGQLNYHLEVHKTRTTIRMESNACPHSELKRPSVSLAFCEGSFSTFFFSPNATLRRPRTVHQKETERVEGFSNEFFNFSELDDVTEMIREGFIRYQLSITENNASDCFLSFWQGIEYLTQSEDRHNTGEVLDRCKSIYFDFGSDDLIDYKTNRLKDKRNSEVHKERWTQFSDGDINLIKHLFEHLLSFYITYREDFDKSDFNSIFDSGYKDKETMKRSIADREGRIKKLQRKNEVMRKRLEDK